MQTLEQRWNSLWQRIHQAAHCAGRTPDTLTLLAVSKTVSIEKIEAAYHLGQRHFAENYLQEALDKQQALAERCPGIIWHFIGTVQRRKAPQVAQHFDWVHSVDRLEVAERLNSARPATLNPLNICIQINISGEDTKHGLTLPGELAALLNHLRSLPQIRPRGLMGMTAPDLNEQEQREQFGHLRHLLENHQHIENKYWNVLSMGMSGDMEAAIAEGATHLRIGTALFGDRTFPASVDEKA